MGKGDHPVNPAVDLVSGEFWGRNPHPELTWLRENAPVYWDGRVWGITTHADVKLVSLNPKRFSNAGGIRRVRSLSCCTSVHSARPYGGSVTTAAIDRGVCDRRSRLDSTAYRRRCA